MGRTFRRRIAFLLVTACILTCLFPISFSSSAKENFTSQFKQVVFDQDDGLGSVEVNCIYQTRSGYIWVGTDSGLYRYNGSEFRLTNLWDTEKADIYCINALFQDTYGRLWVATDNYGLFYIRGTVIQHFSSDYYEGRKCIQSVCEGSDGRIYVASSDGLYIVNESDMLLSPVDALKGYNVQEITLHGNEVWGIAGGSEIFNVNTRGKAVFAHSADYTQDELSCIRSVDDNYVYVGTIGRDVIRLSSLQDFKVLTSGVDGINDIYKDTKGRIFICADNGVGYFERDNTFVTADNLQVDNYISSMIEDYEGNYWFSSTRMGILMLGFSKFVNYNQANDIPQSITNCVTQRNGMKYIGTDQGLLIVNTRNEMLENDLTAQLKGVSIRDILRDSNGNIWVSTYRKYGILKYSPDGTISNFGRSAGLLTNLINCTIELSDGSIAVGTEEGITIIGTDNTLVRNITASDGLEYSNILTLYEDENGRLFAGSDGGGLYIIDGSTITNYTDEDGLTSNVVTCITKGEKGLWLGTDNGLSVYNETIRPISNIDFSNNIYDILCDRTGVWIIGSKGVLKTNEDELLGTNELAERYWTQNDGLDATVTLNSKNFIDSNHILYICTSEGIFSLNTKKIPTNEIPPKITVSEIDVDGETYSFDQIGGSLNVDSDTAKIAISFATLSYTNRENITIEYYLEGFDKEPVVITGTDTMRAVYTNLEGGTYTFTLRAINGDGTPCTDAMTFTITKKMGILEMRTVRIGIILTLLLIIILIVFLVIRFQKAVVGKNKELAELSKEHEVALKSSTAKTDYLANMSNEIKIPINAIIGLAENMIGNVEGDSEKLEDLHSIISSGNDIIDKVDGIILLAKLESGRIAPVNAPYSITTLVCDISDRIINTLGDRPIKFFVEIGENISDILVGDFDKIKDILELILDNAQKFTKEGSITLSVDCYEYNEGKKGQNYVNLVFSVSDTGIGIQEERLEHIFEVYNISDNKKSGSYSGNGIGLAIAKKLTDIMEGELEVESTYGAGSVFTLSLSQKKPEKSIFQEAEDAENVSLISKEEAERMWTPDVTALIVDDVEVSRTVAVSVLNQMEMKVDEAASGVSAIDMVMNNDYDIVFMDMTMPVMSGTDALREIRELDGEEYKKLPIIAMTEDVVGENRTQVMESGFDDVILKPLDIRNLATMLSLHIDQSKIKYKTNDMIQYIRESRYNAGLTELQNYIDVVRILEKIGGSIEVYNKIISTFYNQNLNASEEMKAKFDKDYRGFRNRMHNIRNGSNNIGAVQISDIASKLESAINIGNKGYVRDNLKSFLTLLDELLEKLGAYLEFVEEQQGMTDEEYAAKIAREKMELEEEQEAETDIKPVISEEILRDIQKNTEEKNLEKIKQDFDDICNFRYGPEDMDFITVLGESIDGEDYETIHELTVTYLGLKFSGNNVQN